jgi:hypothetical protein
MELDDETAYEMEQQEAERLEAFQRAEQTRVLDQFPEYGE